MRNAPATFVAFRGWLMGVSRTPGQMAAKIRQLARDLPESGRDGVRAAGHHVKRSIDAQLSADVPSRKLRSGAKHGRSTARALSTRMDDMRRIPDNPAVFISARGPWQVFERPTEAHVITSKHYRRNLGRAFVGFGTQQRLRRSRSQRSKVLAFGGRFAPYVNHPGTKQGKHTFAKGVARAAPQAPRLFEREVARTMGKVFR